LTLIAPTLIPWRQILADLAQRGYSQAKVALGLNLAQSTVERWAQGSEPSFAYGRALLLLHQEVCGPDQTLERINQAVPCAINALARSGRSGKPADGDG
jgi:predicted transcriptional regulator